MAMGTSLRRVLILMVVGAALAGAVFFYFSRQEPAPLVPPAGPRVGKAGQTTDVIPRAWRGETETAGRELARATSVFWQDWVWTERRGRARVAIVDGSILNLGPETRLKVLPQDERTSYSTVELNYGKVRAEVKTAAPGRRFEIRTPTAVIGVVGTEFFIDATEQKTRVLCLEGQVAVRNQQAEVVGEVTLAAGEKTDVAAAAPPAPKARASQAEIEQARALTRSSGLDITLTDRQGNRVNLRERVGRALVVNYWATWAPPALAQIPDLNRLAAEFRDQGVEFIGVAMDSGGWPAVATSERTTPLRFTVLLDEGNRAAPILGIQAIPTTLLVDAQGRVVARWQGRTAANLMRSQIQRLLQP